MKQSALHSGLQDELLSAKNLRVGKGRRCCLATARDYSTQSSFAALPGRPNSPAGRTRQKSFGKLQRTLRHANVLGKQARRVSRLQVAK